MQTTGVFVCALLYTDDGDILTETTSLLPCYTLQRSFARTFNIITDHCKEFVQLLRLNDNFTHNVQKMTEKNFSDETPFLAQFVAAVQHLAQSFGNLGMLYDQPMRLGKTQSMAFFTVNKMARNKNLTSTYKWTSMYDVECKVYSFLHHFVLH